VHLIPSQHQQSLKLCSLSDLSPVSTSRASKNIYINIYMLLGSRGRGIGYWPRHRAGVLEFDGEIPFQGTLGTALGYANTMVISRVPLALRWGTRIRW
jgi:hypothetical protein